MPGIATRFWTTEAKSYGVIGFDCGEYDCSLAYSDFSNDGSYGETIGEDGLGLGDGMDEDALVFSVSASF